MPELKPYPLKHPKPDTPTRFIYFNRSQIARQNGREITLNLQYQVSSGQAFKRVSSIRVWRSDKSQVSYCGELLRVPEWLIRRELKAAMNGPFELMLTNAVYESGAEKVEYIRSGTLY